MKVIWFTLCLAALALSIYPEQITFNGYVFNFHSFWIASEVTDRIAQMLLIVSALGWLRDLRKHKGKVVDRLISRTFIIIGSIMALYYPWSAMGAADPLWAKVLWTVAGSLIWLVAFLLLIADSDPATPAAPKVAEKSAPKAAKKQAETKKIMVQPTPVVVAKTLLCNKCGHKNKQNLMFCVECGATL